MDSVPTEVVFSWLVVTSRVLRGEVGGVNWQVFVGPGSALVVWNCICGIDGIGYERIDGVWTVDIWTPRAWPTAFGRERRGRRGCGLWLSGQNGCSPAHQAWSHTS